MDDSGECLFMGSVPSKVAGRWLMVEVCQYDYCNDIICHQKTADHHPSDTISNTTIYILIGCGVGISSVLSIGCCLIKKACSR